MTATPIMGTQAVAQPPKTEEFAPPRYGLVPASMAEAMKLAEMMASARLVPAALQKSPADCLMVIQQAIRWDMDPFAVAQECSVISGKLMHSGKLVAAVVNARGNLSRRLSYEYRGSGDSRTIIVSGQLQGEPTARIVEVVLGNAKTQNSMWLKQPDQQLMYHGARVWARRHTPELMLGVYSPEEFDDAYKEKMDIEDIPTAAPERRIPKTGSRFEELDEDEEIVEADESAEIGRLDRELGVAAEGGIKILETAWKLVPADAKPALKAALDRRHKPRAQEVDRERR